MMMQIKVRSSKIYFVFKQ